MPDPAEPLLMLTASAALWQHWQPLRAHGWLPQHGRSLADWQDWRTQGRRWVLLDANLPDLPDWSRRAIAAQFNGQQVLVLSTRPSDDQGQHALLQGASGYAHALTAPDELQRILDTIAHGAIWTGRSLLQRLLADVGQRLPPVTQQAQEGAAWAAGLTPREQAVAGLAALGKSNTDIAAELGITERTVRAHLSATFEKLGTSDRLQLALKVHGISG